MPCTAYGGSLRGPCQADRDGTHDRDGRGEGVRRCGGGSDKTEKKSEENSFFICSRIVFYRLMNPIDEVGHSSVNPVLPLHPASIPERSHAEESPARALSDAGGIVPLLIVSSPLLSGSAFVVFPASFRFSSPFVISSQRRSFVFLASHFAHEGASRVPVAAVDMPAFVPGAQLLRNERR